MSISDDKVIPMPDTFQSLDEIVRPIIGGLRENTARRLEQEADSLETYAELKRYCARLIRDGVA